MPFTLTFHGAAGHVTGSCTLLSTNNQKFLIDCGLEQGTGESENGQLSIDKVLPVKVDMYNLSGRRIGTMGYAIKTFSLLYDFLKVGKK